MNESSVTGPWGGAMYKSVGSIDPTEFKKKKKKTLPIYIYIYIYIPGAGLCTSQWGQLTPLNFLKIKKKKKNFTYIYIYIYNLGIYIN
jgi:hypothetical protein